VNRRNFLKASGVADTVPLLAAQATPEAAAPGRIDLKCATIVVRSGDLPNAERPAATVLVEEIEARCDIKLAVSTNWPADGPAIAVSSVPRTAGDEKRPEGFHLHVEQRGSAPVVWIVGADARGALFGAGRLLRELNWSRGDLWLDAPLDVATAPAYPIRGHQLGYRAQANSYDAWDIAQFEKYIRELTFFGINSIEGIPFQDERPTPVMKVGRREMNKAIGQICHRYGLDYWLWLPAEFDLKDASQRKKLLDQCEQLFWDVPWPQYSSPAAIRETIRPTWCCRSSKTSAAACCRSIRRRGSGSRCSGSTRSRST